MIEADVAVVGGGPAGAAASFTLARNGCRVVTLEQGTPDRDKACGDGLTPRALLALAQMGLDSVVQGWQRVPGLRLVANGATAMTEFRLGDEPVTGAVCRRSVLDATVMRHAEDAGADLMYETRAEEPIVEGGRVVGVLARRANRELRIRARWVIDAEGGSAHLLRRLGGSRDPGYPVCLALREYRHAGSAAPMSFDAYPDIHYEGRLVPGYGWAFPVGDGTVNVGVGLLIDPTRAGRKDLHGMLDDFAERLIALNVVDRRPGVSRRGGRLVMGGAVTRPHGPGYAVAGDAAGMANPFTGEGIAYAYETGATAARHVLRALAESSESLDDYGAELRASYSAYYRLGSQFVTMIGDAATMNDLVTRTMSSRWRMRLALSVLTNLTEHAKPTDRMLLGPFEWMVGRGWDVTGAMRWLLGGWPISPR